MLPRYVWSVRPQPARVVCALNRNPVNHYPLIKEDSSFEVGVREIYGPPLYQGRIQKGYLGGTHTGGGGAHTLVGGTVILGIFVKPILYRSRGGTCPLTPPPPGSAPAYSPTFKNLFVHSQHKVTRFNSGFYMTAPKICLLIQQYIPCGSIAAPLCAKQPSFIQEV